VSLLVVYYVCKQDSGTAAQAKGTAMNLIRILNSYDDTQRQHIIESLRRAYKDCRAAGISRDQLPTREHVEVSTNAQLISIFCTLQDMIRIIEEVAAEREQALTELRDAYKDAIKNGVHKAYLPTAEAVKGATAAELVTLRRIVSRMTRKLLDDLLWVRA